PEGRAPIRQGADIFDAKNNKIGYISSGSFSPTLEKPISMGYIAPEFRLNGKDIFAELRGKMVPLQLTRLPFVAHRYVR
ncbi:MAG: glycine cleavage T C-terminal barrel domain-containing protein, partial [Pseudomonadota bacterium]